MKKLTNPSIQTVREIAGIAGRFSVEEEVIGRLVPRKNQIAAPNY